MPLDLSLLRRPDPPRPLPGDRPARPLRGDLRRLVPPPPPARPTALGAAAILAALALTAAPLLP